MAELNVITSMLDDLSQEQPISTALCIGQDLSPNHHQSIQWQYFSVSDFLSLPFTQRYDLGFVLFDTAEMQNISSQQKSQLYLLQVKPHLLIPQKTITILNITDFCG